MRRSKNSTVFIVRGERAEFQSWLEKWPAEFDHFVELRFAHSLSNKLSLEWDTIQLALATVREGERAAAHPASRRWVRDVVEQADRFRWNGIRHLSEQIGNDWQSRSVSDLRQARQLYGEAATRVALIEQSSAMHNDLCIRVPYYLQWYSLCEEGFPNACPLGADLAQLVTSLRQLSEVLNDAEVADFTQFRNLQRELTAARSRLESGLRPGIAHQLASLPARPGDPWQIETILSTPLATAAIRQQLIAASTTIDGALIEIYATPDVAAEVSLTQTDAADVWPRLSLHARIELEFARLSTLSPGDPAIELAKLGDLVKKLEEEEKTSELWNDATDVGEALRQLYGRLIERIDSTLLRNRDLSNAAVYENRLQKLRTTRTVLCLLNPRDAGQMGQITPHQYVQRAEIRNLLVWHAQRWQMPIESSFERESDFFRNAVDNYLRQANAIPFQPHIVTNEKPSLVLTGPTSISLGVDDVQEIELQAQGNGPQINDVWLLLAYDAELLEVDGGLDLPVYRESDSNASRNNTSALDGRARSDNPNRAKTLNQYV